MRVLVTGREGQLARALLAAPAMSGITVIAAGRPTLDLERPETIAPAIEAASPDVVINAAAYTAVDKAEQEPARAMAVNAEGAGHIARACARLGIPVIQISTDYVFDGSLDRPYLETDPTGPISAYGRSKLAGEQAVAAETPRHVILRTAWVYSPWGHNFVKTMLRLGETRRELSVVDDQRGCPTYAPDLAAACLGVCRKISGEPVSSPLWGITNATGAGETTWCGFAREIFALRAEAGAPEVAVRPIPTEQYPTPARRPRNSRLDGARLRELFGQSLPEWRVALRTCLTGISANRNFTRVCWDSVDL